MDVLLQRKQQQDPLSREALATEKIEAEEGIHVQMPVDVTVEEPWAGVVGEEPDGDLIIFVASANAYNAAYDRFDPVVLCAVSATDYVECMLVGTVRKDEHLLKNENIQIDIDID